MNAPKPAIDYNEAAKKLTGEQRQVLECLAKRMSNEKIADKLGISISAVQHRLHHICRKFELAYSEREELVAVAQQVFPEIAASAPAKSFEDVSSADPLTEMELKVLKAVVTEKTSTAAARKLGIPRPTLRKHLKDLRKKRSITGHNRDELAAFAKQIFPEIDTESVKTKPVDRELEIAVVLATGATNKEAAEKLGIKEGTVRGQRKHLSEKYGVALVARKSTKEPFPNKPAGKKGDYRAAAKNLTLRERQVLVRVANGQMSKVIAHHLNMSMRTVEAHRLHIRKKLDFNGTSSEFIAVAVDIFYGNPPALELPERPEMPKKGAATEVLKS